MKFCGKCLRVLVPAPMVPWIFPFFFAQAAFLLSIGAAAFAAPPPDFYLKMYECTGTLGSLEDPERALKSFEGSPPVYACKRESRELLCVVQFTDGSNAVNPEPQRYDILLEAGGHMDFAMKDGAGDYISINRNTHAAVVTNRITHERLLGSKICRGLFLTADELKTLEARDKKPISDGAAPTK